MVGAQGSLFCIAAEAWVLCGVVLIKAFAADEAHVFFLAFSRKTIEERICASRLYPQINITITVKIYHNYGALKTLDTTGN